MEIRFNSQAQVEVGDLSVGDTFSILEDIYMTTDEFNLEAGTWRCVELRTGYIISVSVYRKVYKVDTVLTVKMKGEDV